MDHNIVWLIELLFGPFIEMDDTDGTSNRPLQFLQRPQRGRYGRLSETL